MTKEKMYGLYVDNQLWCSRSDMDEIYYEYKKLKERHPKLIKNVPILIKVYELSMIYEVSK